MSWIEDFLIVAGASLDIFAFMECQGSVVCKVNKRNLCTTCALLVVCQLAALFVGHFLSDLFCRHHPLPNEAMLGELIAAAIFFALGVRLMKKAVKKERLEEHLETRPDTRQILGMAAVSGFYTVLAGIALGFLHTDILFILILLTVLTVAFAVTGMYVGYRLGFAPKPKVYVAGALLLWTAGIDVLVRSVLMQI